MNRSPKQFAEKSDVKFARNLVRTKNLLSRRFEFLFSRRASLAFVAFDLLSALSYSSADLLLAPLHVRLFFSRDVVGWLVGWFGLVWFGLVSTEKLPDTVCRLGSISLHLTSLLFNIPGLCPSNVTPFFIPLTLTFLEVLTCSQSWSRSASPPSPPSPPSHHLPSAAPFPPFLPPPFSPCSPPPLPSTLLHHSLTC